MTVDFSRKCGNVQIILRRIESERDSANGLYDENFYQYIYLKAGIPFKPGADNFQRLSSYLENDGLQLNRHLLGFVCRKWVSQEFQI